MKSAQREKLEQFRQQLEQCDDGDLTIIARVGRQLLAIMQPTRREALLLFMKSGPREMGSTKRKLQESIAEELAAGGN